MDKVFTVSDTGISAIVLCLELNVAVINGLSTSTLGVS